jgi:hypothetical protein
MLRPALDRLLTLTAGTPERDEAMVFVRAMEAALRAP